MTAPDRNPTTDPRVGDTWTRGKATLQITAIDADGRITLTPSGPEIASTPTTWSRAGQAGDEVEEDVADDGGWIAEVPPMLDPGRPLRWGDRVVIRPYEEWPATPGSWVSGCRELAGHEGVINSEGESEGCVMIYLRREPYGTVRDIPATIVRRVSP